MQSRNQSDPSRRVAVVGSINLDTTLHVPTLPAPGETTLATRTSVQLGGKGANQAVAAARLGSRVGLVARVGDDASAPDLVQRLQVEGVDVEGVISTRGCASGTAMVAVDALGENSIVVAPGANASLDASDVEAAADLLAEADVTLIQLEIPLEAALRAAQLARGTVVLNPAPMRAVPGALLAATDLLVPNGLELAALAGAPAPPTSVAAAAAMARSINGPRAVVATLGAKGAVAVSGADVLAVPCLRVDTVDTTGAGDTFCGALADALARGLPLAAAIRCASAAAGLATTGVGAQVAMPRAQAVAEALRDGSLDVRTLDALPVQEPQPVEHQHAGHRLERQIDFLLRGDALKGVARRTPLLDGSRPETAAEHSWHVALTALLLAEWADDPVDADRVVQLLLVHDLVEIEAGDTFAYDEAGAADQAEREAQAAERIFGLLPPDQARWLRALWDEFEDVTSAEARFARAVDRFQPELHNAAAGGGTWRDPQATPAGARAHADVVARASRVLGAHAHALVRAAARDGLFDAEPEAAR